MHRNLKRKYSMQSEHNYDTNSRERAFSMLQNCRRTDCKFLVGTEVQKEVEGHKLILSSASPVFDAMFYGEMAESQATIPIPDIEPDVFQAMLEYIYTDDIKLRSLDEANNLYYAANKYILTNLKTHIVTQIESILTKENVCQAYEFGSMFEEIDLMKKCLDFIKNNSTEFFEKHLNNLRNLATIKMSTLVAILSIQEFTQKNALYFFKFARSYVDVLEIRMMSSTNSEADGELSSPKSSESSMLKATVLMNDEDEEENDEESKADDSTEESKEFKGHDKGTAPSPMAPKEKPNIRPLLEKIHFLTLTPKQFADGPAKSGLLTSEENYAILMNIVSDETNVPMPSGFSTYRPMTSNVPMPSGFSFGR